MIIKCGSSIIGESHKNKEVVCQDWHEIKEKNGIIFAAVADGLGSSIHSDVASKLATSYSVNYCAAQITKETSDIEILNIIKNSFEESLSQIEISAKEKGYELDECDTTLCLAVFFDGILFYGQAGDSGILALRADGYFDKVTDIELHDDGEVDPLCVEEKWVFKKYLHKVRSVALVTDGIWKMFVPPLLKREEYDMDHAMLNFFFNNTEILNLDDIKINEWINEKITLINPSRVAFDDKTMILLIDTDIEIQSKVIDKNYYHWPTTQEWDVLKKKQEENLYKYRSNKEPINQRDSTEEIKAKNKIIEKQPLLIANKIQPNPINKVIQNKGIKIPLIFIIDLSVIMRTYSKVISNGLNMLVSEIKSNPSLGADTLLSIYSFGNKKIDNPYLKFRAVETIPADSIKLTTSDSLAELFPAFPKAIQDITNQCQYYKKSNIRFFTPFIFIISNSIFHDKDAEIKKIKDDVVPLIKAEKIRVSGFGVDKHNYDYFKKIGISDENIIIDKNQFSSLFSGIMDFLKNEINKNKDSL